MGLVRVHIPVRAEPAVAASTERIAGRGSVLPTSVVLPDPVDEPEMLQAY